MAVHFNHTIIASSDQERSALFLADVLNLPPPVRNGRFTVVELDNGVCMDFATQTGPITRQHYAFLVDESGFEHGMKRILALGLDYWADPKRTRPGEINHIDGGRGFYFRDPDNHLLELMTRPYGGVESARPQGKTAPIPKRSIWEGWFAWRR